MASFQLPSSCPVLMVLELEVGRPSWEEPTVEGGGHRVGPTTERVFPAAGAFLIEGEGPVLVTPNNVGEGEEPGTMESMCVVDCVGKDKGEVEGWPFWGIRARKLGGGEDKMAGLVMLPVPF